jgi:hypothetical protein
VYSYLFGIVVLTFLCPKQKIQVKINVDRRKSGLESEPKKERRSGKGSKSKGKKSKKLQAAAEPELNLFGDATSEPAPATNGGDFGDFGDFSAAPAPTPAPAPTSDFGDFGAFNAPAQTQASPAQFNAFDASPAPASNVADFGDFAGASFQVIWSLVTIFNSLLRPGNYPYCISSVLLIEFIGW